MNFETPLKLLKTLKDIGLTANEANIYLALLSIGTNPASTIAKKAELNRATCYNTLDKLMKKGFIEQTIKNNISYFSATDPKQILNKLHNQKIEIDSQIDELKSSIEQLETMKSQLSEKPKVIFFEGKGGILNVMEDTLSSTETIRAYASLDELTQILPNYFPDYYKRRTEKNIHVKGIYPANENTYRHKLRDHLEKRESRLIPPEFDFHLDILIYDDKVAITSLHEQFGLLIKSKAMANAQKKIFDLIWAGTEQYDKLMTNTMAQKFTSESIQKTI
ncbi:hypothetical protein GF340_02370 [Candidatus Peregrinibacteria bacterium]|nr:hypothetical protein [Candidatus Peregrinibacteria bacterium]